MKQEWWDILVELVVRTIPAGFLAWLASVNWLAVTLAVIQVLYLLRKWWREETEWGVKLKRWAEGQFTKPGGL